MSKFISYRSDIDGLRALSVFFVILFHADLTLFSGGYIGVDVFFVISGYLITSSINKQILNQSFSFKEFYLRRIRRIIPVLAFMIISVTIPAYLFMFPSDFEVFSRTAIHTMLSTNNFFLWNNVNNYFVEYVDLMPLLHTWSLSVEEQFYLIWPILLVILHRFFNLHKRLLFIVVFLVLSILLSIYLTHENISMAYFLLPARLFELLMGAVLAMFWDRLPNMKKNINHLISLLGVFLIILPAILLSKNSLFPGLNAFWPCLGTVLLILSGKQKETQGFVNSLLELKLLVFFGLISYSMYLWHWPILVFIKYLGYEFTKQIVAGAIFVTILLSYLSWKFIEQPFRHKFKYNFSKTLLYILLPCFVIIGGIYAIIDTNDGFVNRFPNLAEFNKKENAPNVLRTECHGNYKIGNYNECGLGVVKNKVDGILIGDSFGNHSSYFIDILAKDANMYFHDNTASGYPLLHNVDFYNKTDNNFYGRKRLEEAKRFDIVCIAAIWEMIKEDSENYQLILKGVRELVDSKKKVIIIDHLRMTNQMNLHKMKVRKVNYGARIPKEDLLIPFNKRPENYIINEIKKRFPTVVIVNLNDVMCADNKCSYEINEQIIYGDFCHLNVLGAKLLAQRYIEQKGNPLETWN